MIVLGICGGVRASHHDAAAALFVDGQLVAAAEEERFLRVKHAAGLLPYHAVLFCLEAAKLTIHDVDVIAFNGETIDDIHRRLSDYFRFRFGHSPAVELVPHYVAHAASAYRLSGFTNALAVSADVSGDSVSTFIAHGVNEELRPLRLIPRPNSLGLFYSLITQHLGFARDNDEYKVMGLASYGETPVDLSFLLTSKGGEHTFHHEGFIKTVGPRSPFPSKQEALFSDALLKRLGPSRLPNEPITQFHKDLAYGAQQALEGAMLALLNHYHEQTGATRVCLAGGVALNCVMNQRVAALPWVQDVFVQPAASDAGGCLGAATEVLSKHGISAEPMTHVYLGPSYSDKEVGQLLRSYGWTPTHLENPAVYAAERIQEGQVVGWFQGKMEFGPRSLGNRSILADPRNSEMKAKINATIKFREDFRPFAPAVLEERAAECFVCETPSPHMTMTFDVRDEWKERLASVTHVDGTARLQTVSRTTNPRFHELISHFNALTGVPVVINTSLNLQGQPICRSPRDALFAFAGSGMDSLVIGDWVVEKSRC